MLNEDHWIDAFNKVLNKMCCAFRFFILFIIIINKVLASTRSEHQNQTQLIEIHEIGKGLDCIPKGKSTVKSLNLAYNHISTLPSFIFHNSSYRQLNKIELYQNKITNISVLAFRGLKVLKIVNLSENNITRLDPYTFRTNSKLEKLDLSNNKLNFERLEVFLVSHSLQTLILSNNKIEQIYEVTFLSLTNLKNLILDNNIIFLISPNSFKPLDKLQYLSIANTGVYRLSESMFNNNLPRIIDLNGTPLSRRFDPPITKVTNNAVRSLINIDQYFY